MDFKRFVDIAYALREKTITGQMWHVSFIVHKSKPISIATNNYKKTHPKLKEFNYHPSSRIHSELAAIIKLGFIDCSHLSIINIRIGNNGRICNSMYCLGCQRLVKTLNFKQAYYSDENGEFKRYI